MLVIIISIVYILSCAAVVTFILLQKKRSAGLGGLAGMGQSQTYWDKNKGRSLEGSLEKYTKIGIAVLFAVTVATWFVRL
ncbi:MAG: preprotein translocase subunit SecG [Clostridiales bacterium]|nr:preprotein translocase subunit SecG [Clostridiales bacterium]